MANVIETIQRGNDNVFPRTKVEAITDANGSSLQSLMDAKKDATDVVTSGTSIALADNTEYVLDNVTTLTVTYPAGDFECWMKLTFASSGTITVSLPESGYIGYAPTFTNGDTWELSIKNGVIVAGKVVQAS